MQLCSSCLSSSPVFIYPPYNQSIKSIIITRLGLSTLGIIDTCNNLIRSEEGRKQSAALIPIMEEKLPWSTFIGWKVTFSSSRNIQTKPKVSDRRARVENQAAEARGNFRAAPNHCCCGSRRRGRGSTAWITLSSITSGWMQMWSIHSLQWGG